MALQMALQLRSIKHFGGVRLYFADIRIQRAYEELTNRKTVSEEMLAFLRAIGIAYDS